MTKTKNTEEKLHDERKRETKVYRMMLDESARDRVGCARDSNSRPIMDTYVPFPLILVSLLAGGVMVCMCLIDTYNRLRYGVVKQSPKPRSKIELLCKDLTQNCKDKNILKINNQFYEVIYDSSRKPICIPYNLEEKKE